MTNYVTQFLPKVKPEGWMKIAVGGVLGAVTLDDLRRYAGGSGGNTETVYTIAPLSDTYSQEFLNGVQVFNFLVNGIEPDYGFTVSIPELTSDQYRIGNYGLQRNDFTVYLDPSLLMTGSAFTFEVRDTSGKLVYDKVFTILRQDA